MAANRTEIAARAARDEVSALTLRQIRAEWPYAAVFTSAERAALVQLPTPVRPSAPAR
jgi:hypothetical protein